MARERPGTPLSGWFAARLRYVSLLGADEVPDLIEDRIVLLESDGLESAMTAALAKGAEYQHAYENALGEAVRVRFEGVVELKELFDVPGAGAEVWWEFSEPRDTDVADVADPALLRPRNAAS